MRSNLLSVLGLSSVFLLAACSSSSESLDNPGFAESSGTGNGTGSSAGAGGGGDLIGGTGSASASSGAGVGGGASDASDGEVVGSGEGGASAPQAGTLTAGDWDDNLNFGYFRDFVEAYLGTSQSGPEIASADRIVIKVTADDGGPVSNALVHIAAGSTTYLDAPTASDGRLLFFPTYDGAAGAQNLTVTITPPAGQAGVAPITVPAPPPGQDWTIALPGASVAPPAKLDVAFVVDATGSMGDEIEYLKVEVKGIADTVVAQFGNVSIRYALVVYRDDGDAYETKTFDFTSNLATFQQNLAAQYAEGGGDTPEAMDAALAEVPGLSWRNGNTARVSFLIADAAPHVQGYGKYLGAVDALRTAGIRLYGVAASGVDTDAEYFLRVGAEATLGRYLFLTSDSGVGGEHAEPHIPCYQVQKLNALMLRMIASELSGTRVSADPAEVVRSVGDPVDGTCTFEGGVTASF